MNDNALVVANIDMECKNKNEINLIWIYSVSCVVILTQLVTKMGNHAL